MHSYQNQLYIISVRQITQFVQKTLLFYFTFYIHQNYQNFRFHFIIQLYFLYQLSVNS